MRCRCQAKHLSAAIWRVGPFLHRQPPSAYSLLMPFSPMRAELGEGFLDRDLNEPLRVIHINIDGPEEVASSFVGLSLTSSAINGDAVQRDRWRCRVGP